MKLVGCSYISDVSKFSTTIAQNNLELLWLDHSYLTITIFEAGWEKIYSLKRETQNIS
jgi:hypothetical protein